MMTINQRIQNCRMIEMARQYPKYAENLSLEYRLGFEDKKAIQLQPVERKEAQENGTKSFK